jgi:membrane-associated phospholipid phosphatase
MTSHRPLLTVAAAVSLWLVGAPAGAQPAQTRELRWDPVLDASVTAGGATAWIASELLKPQLAPSSCRWCSVDGLDAGVRDALVWRDTRAADTASNVTGFVLAPLTAVGLNALAAAHDGAFGNAGKDTLLIVEATVIAADVTQLTKMLVGRERPFVHALSPDEKLRTARPADNNLSFFSGHAAVTFALAAAGGTVGTMRGYRWAPFAWIVGGAAAATTAYLRIAADKHWLTDVLVGAVVGAGIGIAVPALFHSAVDAPNSASAAAALGVRGLPAVMLVW